MIGKVGNRLVVSHTFILLEIIKKVSPHSQLYKFLMKSDLTICKTEQGRNNPEIIRCSFTAAAVNGPFHPGLEDPP